MTNDPIEREILHSLWKVHILHHAGEHPVVGLWLLEELREHGYRVSPGTLYPLLARMERIGWLRRSSSVRRTAPKAARPFQLTPAGRRALAQVRARLQELLAEVFPSQSSASRVRSA
jgi:DNA-binding PadR family transcriptional regulator